MARARLNDNAVARKLCRQRLIRALQLRLDLRRILKSGGRRKPCQSPQPDGPRRKNDDANVATGGLIDRPSSRVPSILGSIDADNQVDVIVQACRHFIRWILIL